MLTLPKNTATMGSPLLHEIKKQASCFFKDKIKSARLIFSDVTPVQLMTEEATNENPWPPETQTMRVISRAAFEVDDYWRIVEILHKRLQKFDETKWRASYKALILLEHLLTNGPLRVSEEFQSDTISIKEMGQFQCIDERGFNWGMRVRRLSERIIKLLENNEFVREERARRRQLSQGIEGFGSFSKRTSAMDHGSLNVLPSKRYGRCNSQYDFHGSGGYGFVNLGKKFNVAEENKEKQCVQESMDVKLIKQENMLDHGEGLQIEDEDHPFVEQESFTKASLLSM